MISDFPKPEYFCEEGWTGQISLNRLMKVVFWREAILRWLSRNSLGRLPLGIQPDLIDSVVPGCPIIAERH
jgi:hypothetical protein